MYLHDAVQELGRREKEGRRRLEGSAGPSPPPLRGLGPLVLQEGLEYGVVEQPVELFHEAGEHLPRRKSKWKKNKVTGSSKERIEGMQAQNNTQDRSIDRSIADNAKLGAGWSARGLVVAAAAAAWVGRESSDDRQGQKAGQAGRFDPKPSLPSFYPNSGPDRP